MKALKNTSRLLSDARQLEEASRLTEAAALYQQVADADPSDQGAVSRLLTIYRRLKEPKKELAVIENALAAYAQRDKTVQEKWISAHPQAAKTGRAFLRSLGGTSVSAFGSNPVVSQLLKRKAVVEKKLGGKGRPPKKSAVQKTAARKAAADAAKKAADAQKATIAAKKATAAAKEKQAEERKQATEERKRIAQQKKAIAAARKAAIAAQKAAAREKAAAQPSLFIISLRYLAQSDKIAAMLPKHVAFLDKHFTAGDFLLAGNQVPPTGGIILARGKDRTTVERIMRQAPFLKNKLASMDIAEFTPTRLNKKQWQKML
jgi:uncharacterized protein YciI